MQTFYPETENSPEIGNAVKDEQPLPSSAQPGEVALSKTQTDVLAHYLKEFNAYNSSVQPELVRLSSRFNEFLAYVRAELGVLEGYGLTEDLTKFVRVQFNAPVQVETATPEAEEVVGAAI